jgi:hypothetical protein
MSQTAGGPCTDVISDDHSGHRRPPTDARTNGQTLPLEVNEAISALSRILHPFRRREAMSFVHNPGALNRSTDLTSREDCGMKIK